MNKPYFYRNFFLTDWRHERLKNTIGLLLFYGEHFYGFSESALVAASVLSLSSAYKASAFSEINPVPNSIFFSLKILRMEWSKLEKK